MSGHVASLVELQSAFMTEHAVSTVLAPSRQVRTRIKETALSFLWLLGKKAGRAGAWWRSFPAGTA